MFTAIELYQLVLKYGLAQKDMAIQLGRLIQRLQF